MLRNTSLLLRIIVISFTLSVSLGASALPLSPKWMKASAEGRQAAVPPGELDSGNGGGNTGGGVQELPVPASLWLMVIGGAGMALFRRKKS